MLGFCFIGRIWCGGSPRRHGGEGTLLSRVFKPEVSGFPPTRVRLFDTETGFQWCVFAVRREESVGVPPVLYLTTRRVP